MAGSGKTTLLHRLNHELVARQLNHYFINLDPAVIEVPFNANVNICDTVNFKEVMKQFELGFVFICSLCICVLKRESYTHTHAFIFCIYVLYICI